MRVLMNYAIAMILFTSGVVSAQSKAGSSCKPKLCPVPLKECRQATAPKFDRDKCLIACGTIRCPPSAKFSSDWTKGIQKLRLMERGGVEEQIQFGTAASLKVTEDNSVPSELVVVFLDPVTGNEVLNESIYIDPPAKAH